MPAVRLLSLPILSYSANKIASFLPFDRILIASSSDNQEEREIESINLTENYRTGGGKRGNLPASPAVAQAKAIAPQNAHDAGKVELIISVAIATLRHQPNPRVLERARQLSRPLHPNLFLVSYGVV